MSDLNALELYAKLCGFKLLVLANQFGSSNATSDYVHYELLVRIGDLIELMQDITHAERELLVVTDAERREELEWARRSCERHFVDIWLTSAPCPLLEFVAIDPEAQRYLEKETGQWRPLTNDGPHLVDADDGELCGLRIIMDQIAEETGIRFSAYRVLWGGDRPALAPRDSGA